MAHDTCTICGYDIAETISCPACDAAEAIIEAGAAHYNYHEALAEAIGNLLMSRNWHAKPINLNNMFPRFC